MPDSSAQGIFLSYRRDDTGPYARSLQLQLSQRIPDVAVFMDLDSIEPGLDFAEVIEEKVNSSAVLVALIGRQWATLTDEDGRRRLDNPDDYVRFEVKTALERRVRVIPVLIDGAKPLRHRDLPAELHKLARLNAHKLSYDRYRDDADRLLDLIQRVLAAVSKEEAEQRAQEEAEQEAAEGIPPLPEELRAGLDSPFQAIRIGVVNELGDWLASDDPTRALTARHHLSEIADSNIPPVAATARTLLIANVTDSATAVPPSSVLDKDSLVAVATPTDTMTPVARNPDTLTGSGRRLTPPSWRTRVHLCYRREDMQSVARRLHDRLIGVFGADHIFIVDDSIDPAQDVTKVLDEAVQSCRVLLAIIGPSWADARDQDGRRRLENPHDPVRYEIEKALSRNAVHVIPVLTDDTPVPRDGQLPGKLKQLNRLNAIQISPGTFTRDVQGLFDHLRRVVE